jgi:hypothetical protein
LGLSGSGCRVDDKIERIGIPEGSTGLLTAYVLKEKMVRHDIKTLRFEPYTLYDCCAATTQYALGSGHLDMAIMCPDAAAALIAKDQRFMVVGPVMFNSDILVLHQNSREGQPKVAVSQNRVLQGHLVTARFGDGAQVVPMMHGAVPFAFARGQVDGAVLDITKAFTLAGKVSGTPESTIEVATAVLVVKQSLISSDQYQLFIKGYIQALDDMADQENLLELLRGSVSKHIHLGDINTWKAMNVKFANPFASRRHE